MRKLDFGDGSSYFGSYFKPEDLNQLVQGNRLVISGTEKIRLYEKGGFEEKFYSFFHKTIDITIGDQEFICNTNSLLEKLGFKRGFFEKLGLKKGPSDRVVMQKFVQDILGNETIKEDVERHRQDALPDTQTTTTEDVERYRQEPEQVTQTTTSESSWSISEEAEPLVQTTVLHDDESESEDESAGDVQTAPAMPPPQAPPAEEATLLFGYAQAWGVIRSLEGLGIRARDDKVSNFLQYRQNLSGAVEMPLADLHTFILQHFDPTTAQSSQVVQARLALVLGGDHHPVIAYVCQVLQNAPQERIRAEQLAARFLGSEQGQAFQHDEEGVKKVAIQIFINMPIWQKELESSTHYQGLKITKKISGLSYGISVEYNPDTKACDLLIKGVGKDAAGSYKKVMFPVSWMSEREVVFAVPHKGKRSAEDMAAIEKESRLLARAEGLPNVVQGRLKRFIKWPPTFENRMNPTVALILENMNLGPLDKALKTFVFTPAQLKQITLCIALGLEQLHTLGPPPIIHEDIKPANILLHMHNGQIIAKFADLGESREDAHGHISAGSPIFESPEKLLKQRMIGDGFSDDRWSTAVTFFYLKHLRYPGALQTSTVTGLYQAANNPETIRRWEPADPNSFDHLIWEMLDPDVYMRPTNLVGRISAMPESAFV